MSGPIAEIHPAGINWWGVVFRLQYLALGVLIGWGVWGT